ncbi:MAG: hypothetical protein HUK26_08285, partial [Duodenibacillus sp.]|nr:hypothetical protein [Duodenibacillus sp.]
ARTLCRETFSDCRLLTAAGRIFAPSRVPAHLEGFMRGCPPPVFGCLRRIDREAAGLPYAPPTTASPCFEFLWSVRDSSPREVLRFYPCERKLQGGLLIEWGDGSGQYVDFQGADAVEHAFPSERCKGSSRVRLHYTDGFEVRPFKTGAFTSAYLTPLPPWAGRDEGNAGDYCGWAAGLRLLKHVPEGFFARNPGIRNLEQAFAGCTALRTAPDDIVEGLSPDLKADGMFAFCNALPRLPASYKALRRDASLDFFAGKEDDRA